MFYSFLLFSDFDVNMTKELLVEIISKMEDEGFNICGVIFDCGNQTLIKDCEIIQSGKFSFPNPRDPNRNVYLFPGIYFNIPILVGSEKFPS